jgi:predicted nucleic-acid-binding Zn-ribbon protein
MSIFEPDECPRCGHTEFYQHDCGPDSYDDDISWIAFACKNCGLYYSTWADKWLIDCTNWRDEEGAEAYEGST